jgi:hypothetical protein
MMQKFAIKKPKDALVLAILTINSWELKGNEDWIILLKNMHQM